MNTIKSTFKLGHYPRLSLAGFFLTESNGLSKCIENQLNFQKKPRFKWLKHIHIFGYPISSSYLKHNLCVCELYLLFIFVFLLFVLRFNVPAVNKFSVMSERSPVY